jgi:primosomal protein N' (replication factor Y)
MSAGERYDQYKKALNAEINVVIGPRSALFLPFPELGIIVMDEEHEPSYKNENTPKYHAREVAIQRAKTVNASVVLVSATPSLESFTKAKNGEYQYFEMRERVGEAMLPKVHIADLRQEFAMKNHSIFSKLLQELILYKLKQKEQIMLFLNRRGYSGFVSCRKCGEVLTCVHCDVSYKAHIGKDGKVDTLVCHYCGHSIRMPRQCPKCGSEHIAGFGIGTEQLEQITKQTFPHAGILRMDADTTSKKGSHEEVLGKFRRKEADILIGTQMIVKGHDFPSVTLVGVIAADLSMFTGDYHSSERTFQLLMQASGRAGRGQMAGEVVIQTYQPEHHCIVAVKEQSYERFYEKEMVYRKVLRYPPIYPMMVILFMSKNEQEGKKIAETLALEAKSYRIPNVIIIGPAKANISKKSDWYRYTLYIKCNKEEGLYVLKDKLENTIDNRQYKKTCGIQFDLDPMNSY